MIIAIACIDRNYAIGKDNKLLFHFKKDMEFFKEKTYNHPVAMGRKTFESLPGKKPLPGRKNLVLCSQETKLPDGVEAYHSFDSFLKEIQKLAKTDDVYIIGGGKVYGDMLKYCDKIYLTKVGDTVEGATVFFPNLNDSKDFELTKYTIDYEDGHELVFCEYNKIKKV